MTTATPDNPLIARLRSKDHVSVLFVCLGNE